MLVCVSEWERMKNWTGISTVGGVLFGVYLSWPLTFITSSEIGNSDWLEELMVYEWQDVYVMNIHERHGVDEYSCVNEGLMEMWIDG